MTRTARGRTIVGEAPRHVVRPAVAAILAAGAALVFATAGCGGPAPEPGRRGATSAPAGGAIYDAAGCGACHDADRRGTDKAPSLLDLRQNWTADALAGYLADPDGFRKANPNPRLEDLDAKYAERDMPPFDGTPDDRRALARWLVEASR